MAKKTAFNGKSENIAPLLICPTVLKILSKSIKMNITFVLLHPMNSISKSINEREKKTCGNI